MSETTTTAPASAGEGAPASDSADYDALITEYGGDDSPSADPAPETASESAPAPAPSKEAEDDLPPDGRSAKALYAELKRTRERAQKAEESARKAYEAAIEAQRARPQPQQPAAPEIPDVDADPVGHFRAKTALLERQLAQIAQPMQQAAREQQFAAAAKAAVHEYAATVPDYNDAYTHATTVMQGMAAALGTTPGEVERMIALRAMQAGKNPGQAVYEFARASGYAGPKPAQQPAAAPQQVMETLERGALASRTVGGGGGRQPPRVTIEAIANMTAREFAEFERRNPDLVERAFREGG